MAEQAKEPAKAEPKKAPSGKMTREKCLELGLDPVPYGFKAK